MSKFVICLKNTGFEASLEIHKVYQTQIDEEAAKKQLIRVVDESGEDYLYPEDYFAPIELPQEVQQTFPHKAA